MAGDLDPRGKGSPLLTIAFATPRGRTEAEAFAREALATSGFDRGQVSVLAYAGNREGLCRVIRDALRRADGKFLAFLHDDVGFGRARGWARTLARVLDRHPRYSVLGVAGASILQDNGYWYNEQVSCGHVWHVTGGETRLTRFAMPHEDPLPAAALDGFFLFARTEAVRQLELNDTLFDGFHFYDMELSIRARLAGLELAVTDAVDLEHRSTGSFGEDWERYRRAFAERYREHLPLCALAPSDLFPFRDFSKRTTAGRSVAVLIPTKNGVDLVRNAVLALRNRTAAGIRYQVYVLDTGSSAASLAELRRLPGVRVVELGYYNFAAIHNDVILRRRLVREDLLLFHNNDVEAVNDVLSHLLHAHETTPRPGIVGARLHFPDGLVQHAGIRVAVRGGRAAFADHFGHRSLWNYPEGVRRGVAGNSFALALMERELYEALGGLNEGYESCFEDVELNLRAILAGRTNVLAGDAVAIHRESATRNVDPDKLGKLRRDFGKLAAFIEWNLPRLEPHLELLPEAAGPPTLDFSPREEGGEAVRLWEDPNRFARPAGIELGTPLVIHGYQEYRLSPQEVVPSPEDPALERKRALVERHFRPEILSGKSVLDLGANGGFFSFWARQQEAAEVIALDMDDTYLRLVRAAQERVGLDRIRTVHGKVQDWHEPADMVLAFALVHWLYSCTAAYGSLDAVVAKLSSLTRQLLIVEWVEPDDPAVQFFRHTNWNPAIARGPYERKAFEDALDRHFPRVERLGEVSPTRILFAAHRTPHEITLGGELPPPESVREILASRCLAEIGGVRYWSLVALSERAGRVVKRTTGDLAWHEAELLRSLEGPRFPRVLSARREKTYSEIELEWIEGKDLAVARWELASSPERLEAFARGCLEILERLRAARIRHRDIRLANLRVREGLPVLLDFGWAERVGEAWLTPEGLGAEGRPPDGGFCDTYSMGALLRRIVPAELAGHFSPLIAAMTDREAGGGRTVIPAKAGIQSSLARTPACAGVTHRPGDAVAEPSFRRKPESSLR